MSIYLVDIPQVRKPEDCYTVKLHLSRKFKNLSDNQATKIYLEAVEREIKVLTTEIAERLKDIPNLNIEFGYEVEVK